MPVRRAPHASCAYQRFTFFSLSLSISLVSYVRARTQRGRELTQKSRLRIRTQSPSYARAHVRYLARPSSVKSNSIWQRGISPSTALSPSIPFSSELASSRQSSCGIRHSIKLRTDRGAFRGCSCSTCSLLKTTFIYLSLVPLVLTRVFKEQLFYFQQFRI